MEKVRLGKSDLVVSKIGFGGIPIQRLSEADAIEVIRRAIELGADWIDTANGYGTSEERIGKAVKSCDRNAVKIFSKAAGKTPEGLRSRIELSFERMQLDYIDLYQFHGVNTTQDWEEILANGCVEMLLELKRQGRIRHIGASSHSADVAGAVMDSLDIEVMQFPFNFVVADAAGEVLEKCKSSDVGFIAMKPFAGGCLDDARLCVRFLLQYPDVAADVGFEKISEVQEVVALADDPQPVSREDKELIAQMQKELGRSFCRRCGYCSPCPEGVSIVALMIMKSIIKRFCAEEVIRPDGWVAKAAATAEQCTQCGECEKKCPYKLPIRRQIQKGAEMFDQFKRQAGSAAKT